MVDSNEEHGEGRSDVVVYDSLNGRVAVFEAKYSKSLNDLDTAWEKAVQQKDDLMYDKSFEDDYDEVFCYGISFYKKRCVVKKKIIQIISCKTPLKKKRQIRQMKPVLALRIKKSSSNVELSFE